MDGGAKQIARLVALSALFLLPLAPLLVASSFFFPFITGKAFYLRILIEVLVVAWAVLALLDRAYRPRFSWLGAIAIAFVTWMLIADSFAPNALKALWSNFERMEGWVLLVHLLGFLFAASAILRVEQKRRATPPTGLVGWRAWFLTSLGVSLVVSAYALLQLINPAAFPIHQGSTRIDASLGNSAYLAIYLLWNVFIALWLAFTEKQAWLKYSLFALAALEGVLIFFTETRGTILGLIIALFLAALLTAVMGGGRMRHPTNPVGGVARRLALGGVAAIVLFVGGLYLARDSALVQSNHTLERLASISLADGETRFTIWGMAWQGFLERPVLGWGQEGFNYVFNKHYEPSLYRQEAWFDRAHNAFIDWLSAGGLPAFLLYLGLFGTAFFLLWRRSSDFSRPERTLLTAALIGYAVHNVFVFDNVISYLYFFAILALIDAHTAREVRYFERAPELSPVAGTTYALPMAAVAVAGLLWFVNVPGMRAAHELVVAISPAPSGPEENIARFERLVQHPSFAAQEVREQVVAVAGAIVQNQSVPVELKQRAVALAVAEMEKQVERYPRDARARLQLAYAYRTGGDLARAFAETEAAVALSPRKQQMRLEAGQVAWEAGDNAAAREYLTSAYALDPQFTELAAYAAAGEIIAGNVSAADRLLTEAYGTTAVDSDILGAAYFRTKNWPRLIQLWRMRAERPGASVQTWFGLAAAYYASGDNASAITTVRKAVELYPDAADAGAAAIAQIQGAAQ